MIFKNKNHMSTYRHFWSLIIKVFNNEKKRSISKGTMMCNLPNFHNNAQFYNFPKNINLLRHLIGLIIRWWFKLIGHVHIGLIRIWTWIHKCVNYKRFPTQCKIYYKFNHYNRKSLNIKHKKPLNCKDEQIIVYRNSMDNKKWAWYR
jgi:hypothetical protein